MRTATFCLCDATHCAIGFDHGVEMKMRGPIWLGAATPRPLVTKLVCRVAPAEQPLPLQHAARRRSSSQRVDFLRSQFWCGVVFIDQTAESAVAGQRTDTRHLNQKNFDKHY